MNPSAKPAAKDVPLPTARDAASCRALLLAERDESETPAEGASETRPPAMTNQPISSIGHVPTPGRS